MKNYHILIVDDEDFILWSMERMLEDTYQVFTATSAAEGMEWLQKVPIHIVLCDQRMPKVRGTEFLEQVRHQFPAIVTILITCLADHNEMTSAIKNGIIDKYIEKGHQPQQLLKEIENACTLFEQRN